MFPSGRARQTTRAVRRRAYEPGRRRRPLRPLPGRSVRPAICRTDAFHVFCRAGASPAPSRAPSSLPVFVKLESPHPRHPPRSCGRPSRRGRAGNAAPAIPQPNGHFVDIPRLLIGDRAQPGRPRSPLRGPDGRAGRAGRSPAVGRYRGDQPRPVRAAGGGRRCTHDDPGSRPAPPASASATAGCAGGPGASSRRGGAALMTAAHGRCW